MCPSVKCFLENRLCVYVCTSLRKQRSLYVCGCESMTSTVDPTDFTFLAVWGLQPLLESVDLASM